MPSAPELDKPTFDGYAEWLRDRYDIDLEGGGQQSWYDTITPRLQNQFINSAFWKSLTDHLPAWNDSYSALHNSYDLLRDTSAPAIQVKGYSSVVEKTYRYNILQNHRWPSPPIPPTEEELKIATRPEEAGKWYGPDNWVSLFPDIIRTRLTVKFLDGVPWLADNLARLADEVGTEAQPSFQARPDGYHGVHVLIGHTFEVFDLEKRIEVSVPGLVEVQVKTQIEESIVDLLHTVYERWRLEETPPERWQWDHNSPDFAVNYLGHTLHYLEGMMVVARERLD